MVRNVIKVFARLKKESPSKKVILENYIISRSKPGYDDIILHHASSESARYPYSQFRYHKIFDQSSSQKEIFDTVAKPVVSSVIHGFNGTIFAYGQTGSGKTYSITGCPKIYENRGIIPRCIEHIFEYLNQNPDVYTVHLSYLEIYNEIGYDLLNPKQIASKLEEFPRVLLLEDGKGEAHLRNLSIHPVSTEKEAMRLLFLGDTNRTIAETPMNEYSSRSHCIFTIYLNSRMKPSGKNMKSKLHIVDLAGSERLRKSNITGTTLNEAKNINLSLHYLEQVILALSSSKKGHVPFRNSMLTYLLRDSLCGNSLTTMLATLAITKRNIDETISTCRFSRRVSMISTDPMINEEEFDSQQEICNLQNEISELKSKLSKYERNPDINSYYTLYPGGCGEMLSIEKQENCKKIVQDFLAHKSDITELTFSEMKFCMEVMRDIHSEKNSLKQGKVTYDEQIQDLENRLKQKEDEMIILKELLESQINSSDESKNGSSMISSSFKSSPGSTPTTSTSNEILSPVLISKIKSPRHKFENDIQEYNTKLESKYQDAKSAAAIIDQCKQNIITIRTKLDHQCTDQAKNQLNAELYHQQDIYRKTILQLKEIEKETNHLKLGLLQVEMKLKRSSSAQSSPRNSSDAFLGVPFNDKVVHHSRMDKYRMARDLEIPLQNALCNAVQKSDAEDVLSEYFSRDYNRAERENEGTFTLLPLDPEIDKYDEEYTQDQNSTTRSFLKSLVDQEDPFITEFLGLSQANYDETTTNIHFKPNGFDSNNKFPPNLSKSTLDNKLMHSIQNELSHSNSYSSKFKVPPDFSKSRKSSIQDEMLEQCYLQNTSLDHLSSRIGNRRPRSEKAKSELLIHTDEQRYPRNGSNSAEGSKIIHKREPEFAFKIKFKDKQLHTGADSTEFKEFMKSIPLTGDQEVDDEIFNFYRSKFRNKA